MPVTVPPQQPRSAASGACVQMALRETRPPIGVWTLMSVSLNPAAMELPVQTLSITTPVRVPQGSKDGTATR